MARKPQLIVGVSGEHEAINYMCSCCSRAFPLPEDQSPKEAVANLYQSFRDHVELEHSESSPGRRRLPPTDGEPNDQTPSKAPVE